MALSLSLARIVLPSRLSVVTNFYPTCRQLLVSKPVSGYRTPLMLVKPKTTGPQQVPIIEAEPPQEKNPDVQVFDETGKLISRMKKDKALKFAKSKELKLVELKQSKSSKQPLSYQLMTGKQLHENRQIERQIKKDQNVKTEEKLLTLKGSISDHDLGIKINKMKSFLEKDFDLRISIKTPKANEEKNRKQQSHLLKKITEETADIAMLKKASSTDSELILLLRKKSLPT